METKKFPITFCDTPSLWFTQIQKIDYQAAPEPFWNSRNFQNYQKGSFTNFSKQWYSETKFFRQLVIPCLIYQCFCSKQINNVDFEVFSFCFRLGLWFLEKKSSHPCSISFLCPQLRNTQTSCCIADILASWKTHKCNTVADSYSKHRTHKCFSNMVLGFLEIFLCIFLIQKFFFDRFYCFSVFRTDFFLPKQNNQTKLLQKLKNRKMFDLKQYLEIMQSTPFWKFDVFLSKRLLECFYTVLLSWAQIPKKAICDFFS